MSPGKRAAPASKETGTASAAKQGPSLSYSNGRGVDHALAVAAAGYRVLPVELIDGRKQPLIKAYSQRATSDPAEIRRWWRRFANALVGLSTGHGDRPVVADLDVKDGKSGPDHWSTVVGEYEIANTTPSGGQHAYYRTDDAWTNRVDVPVPGVDGPSGVDVRGEGGMVVAYQVPPPFDELPTLPPAAARLLKPSRPKDRYVDRGPERPAEDGLHPYAAAAIARELARLDECTEMGWSEGHPAWDQTTFNVACNLVEFANSGWTGYTLEQAEADLMERAPTDGGFGPARHKEKWEGALTTVGDGGRRNPDRTAEEDFDAVPLDDDEIRRRFPPLDLAALLDPNRPERLWFWEGLMPTGDQIGVYSKAGLGKSFLALALCVTAASGGTEFIGRRITFAPTAKIHYVDMENSEDDWRERLNDLGWDHESVGALRDRFIPLSLPALSGLDTAKGAAQLKAIVKAYGIGESDVIVLDSTQRITEGEENSNDTIRNLYNHTSSWLRAAKITVIRTDNSGHNSEHERGASGKRDDVGYAFRLDRIKPGQFRLTNVKHRSRGQSETFAFEHAADKEGRLVFRPIVDAAPVLDFNELPSHMEDLVVVAWVLTGPHDDPRRESDSVTKTELTGRVGKNAKVARNGVDQLAADGYLEKTPKLDASGKPINLDRPLIKIGPRGIEWVEERREWVGERLTELAERWGQK